MSIQNRVASWGIRGIGLLVVVFFALLPSDSSARAALQSPPLAIQVPNLVGYWCVDGLVADTTTIARDSSGNLHQGTYVAGAAAMSAAPPVPAGNLKSFSFVQSGRQYITVPSA